ncbi:MAG: hypothetical protein FK733_16280 [Asgard group archaeon]|nr:hypothetical protein [Asgard group archaeon]
MASIDTIYAMVGNWIALFVVGFLTFSVFRNFLRKKTTGTLLLFTTYLVLFIVRILTEIQKILQALGYFNDAIMIMMTISITSSLLVSIFLYAFGCRGLITDSEYTRTLVVTFLAMVTGGLFTIMIIGIYIDLPGIFTLNISQQTADIKTISATFVTIIMIIVQMIIYFRLAISSFRLAKNSEELVRKRGFQFIAWGLVIYIIGGVLSGASSALPDSMYMTMIIETIRRLIFITAYIMLYIGWTMPDWFRKRVRRKSWFTKQYVAEIRT